MAKTSRANKQVILSVTQTGIKHCVEGNVLDNITT